ncbi:hypothetical protein IRJ41_016951, partial [Triplophysa rosa]
PITIISLILLLQWSQGSAGASDVEQEPKILWRQISGSATMNCTHNKGINYYQMYWYRQRPGETMRLIVFTSTSAKADFGDDEKNKFDVHKSAAEFGSLTVKHLNSNDSGMYFCSVSEHSMAKAVEYCTKTL